jgi:hypothetical protein
MHVSSGGGDMCLTWLEICKSASPSGQAIMTLLGV